MARITTVKSLSKELRKRDGKVVLVGGTFDILHLDHIKFLERSARLGKVLVVGITSDKNVRARKGNGRPVFTQSKRAEVVSALRAVDHVFVSDLSAYNEKILLEIKPDIVVFALEGGKKLHRKKYKPRIEKNFPDIQVRFVNTGTFSTTKIIEHLRKKDYRP